MRPMAATGRAGRLRLRRRLAVAQRGVELLDRKQRVIAAELERAELQRERTAEHWAAAWAEAAAWLARCTALDGVQGVEDAALNGVRDMDGTTVDGVAQVEVEWAGAMGVIYPQDARCVLPDVRPVQGSSALALAGPAHRRAVEAAARHAAAERAVRLLSEELAATRALRRAIEIRWVPRLAAALHDLEVRLDEADREENLRIRWSATTREVSP